MASTKRLAKSAEQIDSLLSNESTQDANIAENTSAITGINQKIPAQASSENQLADKAFVNSSIQTAAANFRGAWASWAAVPTDSNNYPIDYTGSKIPTVNDYLVVQDASGYDASKTGTWRFKYSGAWGIEGKSGWLPEYQINEEPLTTAQIASLNSGITTELVAKIGTIGNVSSLTTTDKSSAVNAVNEVNGKVDWLTPISSGSINQVLTMGSNNKPIWQNQGGVETVTLQLSVESGSGSVAGVPISVSVEGENVPRSLTTDSAGRLTFRVDFGLQYIITFGTIEGYMPVASLTYRAALLTRALSGIYQEDITITNEHMIVSLNYTSEGAARATSISIQTNSGTTSHAIVNNRCEVDIPLGTNYTIAFPAVEGFATPPSQSFTASFNARQTKAYYFGAVTGISWIKTADGSTIPFNDLTTSNISQIMGLRISTSLLSQQEASFVVPIEYLVSSNIIIDGQTIVTASSHNDTWGPQVLLESLPCYTSSSAATTPDIYRNLDGYNNTSVYLAEAASKSLTLPAMAWCRQQSYTIDGIAKTCFLGSYAQMKALSDNTGNIDTLLYGVFGVHSKTFNSGNWWTSSQYSAAYAVLLGNGSFSYNYYKSNYLFSVVPLLAY